VLLRPNEFRKSGEQQAQQDIINSKVLVQFPGSLTINEKETTQKEIYIFEFGRHRISDIRIGLEEFFGVVSALAYPFSLI